MKKSKVSAAIAAVAMSLGMAGAANAFTILAGDVKISMDNYDTATTGYGGGTPFCTGATGPLGVSACNTAAGVVPAPGSNAAGYDTMGIFSVSTISRISDGAIMFQKGGSTFLTGIFSELADWTVNSAGAPFNLTQALGTGGKFKLWENTSDYLPALFTPTITATMDLNSFLYPGVTNNGIGSLFLEGDFVNGSLLAADPYTSYRSIFDKALAGTGAGYLDVTGGSAKALFDTNSLPDINGVGRDLYATFTYDNINGAAAPWSVKSVGQISGQVIPEPGSLALVALALLGAGVISRRNKA